MAPTNVGDIVKHMSKPKAPKEKPKRFLDFQLATNNINSGTQQYGAGQTMSRNARTTGEGYMPINQAPMTISTSAPSASKSVIVEEREPIGVNGGLVNGSVNFESSLVLRVNPGLSDYFDWASRSANLYERYLVEELYVEFVPSVSAYADAGKAGRIILTADYNAAADGPANVREAEVNVPNALGVPYGTVRLTLNPRLCTTKPGKFVRSGPVAGDITLHDAAVIHFSTTNFENTGPIGQLFVGYRFRLLDPQLRPSTLQPSYRAVTFSARVARTVSPPGIATHWNPASGWQIGVGSSGMNSAAFGNGTLPVSLVNDGSESLLLRIPRGHYLVTFTAGFTIAGVTGWQSSAAMRSTAVSPDNSIAVFQDVQKDFGMALGDVMTNRLSALVSIGEETQDVAFSLLTTSAGGGLATGFVLLGADVGIPMLQLMLLD